MRKGARFIIGRYSGGDYFTLTLALSLRERGQKESLSPTERGQRKAPVKDRDKYEDEEVSGTGLGRKLGFV